MERILVSSCLLGFRVRYDGSDKRLDNQIWERWQREGRLLALCPELSAGLPTPRPPAEIIGGGGGAVLAGRARIVEKAGGEVTGIFLKGAEDALALVKRHRLRIAVLTDGSPSCGSRFIYDGTFSGQRIDGEGVVAALLRKHGVRVFGNDQLPLVRDYLERLEKRGRV